jgi:hypothetical protein
MTKRNAVCLITINPSSVWTDFLKKFQNYDVFIVVDNLNTEYDGVIKITNDECIQHGYIHSSYMPNSSLTFNEIIAWDRALYYFTNINICYDNVWFFEDDVFFYDENTLLNIDKQIPESDILCKEKNPEPKEGEWNWFWPAIHINFPPPYFHSPICAVRMSNRLLSHLNEYVKRNKVLFFIEAMFPSIVHYNNLKYDSPSELGQLHWRKDWTIDELNKKQVFHPMKNMEQQREFRSLLMLQSNTEGEIGAV